MLKSHHWINLFSNRNNCTYTDKLDHSFIHISTGWSSLTSRVYPLIKSYFWKICISIDETLFPKNLKVFISTEFVDRWIHNDQYRLYRTSFINWNIPILYMLVIKWRTHTRHIAPRGHRICGSYQISIKTNII